MTVERERTRVEQGHHLHAGKPLYFPAEAEVPETKRHLELRTLLYQLLKLGFADRAAIGCDQFVYWDPADPHACLAPDAFVCFGEKDHLFRSWKVWEHGAPQVAVEIISDSDERDRDWDAKVEKYRRLGIRELVRFDPEASEQQLRIWDAVDGKLTERDIARQSRAQSHCLPGFWLVTEQPETGFALRLSHDERGARLYPTLAEHEAESRRVAEQRIVELEDELRRKS